MEGNNFEKLKQHFKGIKREILLGMLHWRHIQALYVLCICRSAVNASQVMGWLHCARFQWGMGWSEEVCVGTEVKFRRCFAVSL